MAQQASKNSIKRTWKKSAGFVLAFVLFLGFCGMFFSLDLWLGFLNKQSVVTAVADSQYSARAYEQMREDLEALMKDHSLEGETALALVDEDEFYTASGNMIKKTMKEKAQDEPSQEDLILEGSTSQFQWSLNDEITRQLTDKGIAITPELKLAIEEIAFKAGSIYSQHIDFQFGEQFTKARETMVPMLQMMFFVSLGISFVAGMALILFYRRRHAALSYINYALFGSVIANLLVVGLLYVTNPMGETTASLYYQNFIEQYITQSLVPGLGLSAIGLIVAGVLWVAIRRIQKEA